MKTGNIERARIGVVGICYNEEKDIAQFVRNLHPWVDEIVLVDDGSQDRTLEIAKAESVKVKIVQSPRKPEEGYCDQRNKGIDAATSDWLIHLDIDEWIPPEMQREILAVMQNPELDGYLFRRKNFFLNRPVEGSGWGRWASLRLARREALRFEGKIHERGVLQGGPARTGKLETRTWHFNEESYEKRLRKSLNYTLMEGQKLNEAQREVGVWHMVVRPIWAFTKSYFLFLGMRDGVTGLILAMRSFTTTFDATVLAWSAQNSIPRTRIADEFATLK